MLQTNVIEQMDNLYAFTPRYFQHRVQQGCFVTATCWMVIHMRLEHLFHNNSIILVFRTSTVSFKQSNMDDVPAISDNDLQAGTRESSYKYTTKCVSLRWDSINSRCPILTLFKVISYLDKSLLSREERPVAVETGPQLCVAQSNISITEKLFT